MYLPVAVVVAFAIGVTYGDLVHSCLPDGTVQVINPYMGLYSHVFAVQDEGVSAAIKCSVSTSGAESNITGCSQDNTIVVWFSNRAGSVDTFAGTSAISYEVQCNDLPSGGVDKTVVNNLAANIEVTTQDIVTPSFVVSSELRSVNQLGSPVSSATVGDIIYWTIDIPVEYSAVMLECGAFSGFMFGSPHAPLVEQGCAVDRSLMGSNFDNIETGVYGIKRYWAVVYVFKFYNSDNVVFDCLVHVCPSGSSACDAFDATAEHITDINSALTITGWRSADELDSMSTENKRNTLIVELLYHSNLNTQQLQAKQNTGSLHSLTGMTAIFYFLYTNSIRSIHDLRSMSDHDQRHTLIEDLQNKVNKNISELQGMSDHQLVVSGADFYRKSCSKKKRSVGSGHLIGPDDKTFSTSRMLHILPGANGAATTLGIGVCKMLIHGNLWRLAVGAGVLILFHEY